MLTGLIDIIISIIQSVMFIIASNYCVNKQYKKSKLQSIILIAITSFFVIFSTYLLGNSSLGIIVIHMGQLLLTNLMFKDDKLGATIGFSIIYSIIGISANLSFVIFTIFNNISTSDNIYAIIIILYFPQFIISYFVLKNMKFIHKINLIIKSRVSSIITLIIGTVVFDFIMSFSRIISDKDNPVFKEIIFVLLGGFIIFIAWHFINIDKNSKQVYILNEELESKINELKKIKHDYGSQISYLYGAYLMNNYEKLGELLKGIIEGNDISTQVKVLSNEDSIIAQVVNSTDLKEVDVLIDEKAELKDTNISELELHKIISNIVRNSIEALKGRGLLMINSYYSYNHVIISLQNNGPEIDKNIIDRIFEEGFSTKKNKNGDNGFGLHIVKEIVDKNNGHISVTSNKEVTKFVIKLPLHI
ncbi:ATP-binding protein [Clostridium tertium]|jgi:two-component system, LytTR family, sensor histidine kinase AgrC|uniref:sensor histidine kinase n=1 Tax=Clostridium TaxID=1485 RepID=UPI00115AC65A|nr:MULTISPECIES: ATP-binding protein [Clostridium]MBS5884184.1 GHKL domain-containing protein [Clostridium sp.]MDB1924210.1 ATP-binding protein [Clostridium tertium]MDB1927255.1 ATP-binding protein [Clostridium tertium]MDB1929284.1 ATP-binding protein [Clostridium tertium]MDB1932085.1 ATP-binding protein [Clostridium tertium]